MGNAGDLCTGVRQTFSWLVDLGAKQCGSPIPRNALAVNNKAKLIAVNERNSIVLVDRASGNELFILRHDAGVSSAVFSSDGRTLATATDGGACICGTSPPVAHSRSLRRARAGSINCNSHATIANLRP